MAGKRDRTQADLRQMEKHYREQGFTDGKAGRPARSTSLVYQQAWRRGVAERRKDGAAEAHAARLNRDTA